MEEKRHLGDTKREKQIKKYEDSHVSWSYQWDDLLAYFRPQSGRYEQWRFKLSSYGQEEGSLMSFPFRAQPTAYLLEVRSSFISTNYERKVAMI